MELIAPANGIEVAYEAFGDPADPTALLVMGLGVQMLGWDDAFCELLAGRGLCVVRFDNRDVGRSTKIEGGPRPDIMAAATGDTSSASYALDDMADDCAGLLDHLGVEGAHVVGASQGGMIAQTLAIRNPERVLSLVSIMSTTGDRAVGQPHP
jgi:pimeloyl-ACP methyl ester carboxylesterase